MERNFIIIDAMERKNGLSRRKFLWRTVSSTAAVTLGTRVFAMEKELTGIAENNNFQLDSERLDPIIPFEFYPKLEKEMLSHIITLHKQYGFRRFLLTGPSKEYRYTGFPNKAVFTSIGDQIMHVKKQLSEYDIEIGWWCTTTIRIGKGPFQSIVKLDGSISKDALCPLDPAYRETFSEYVSTVVQIARPFWVNFEDDFHLSGGCYCPLHLEEFKKRQKKSYSREGLQSIMQSKTPEANRLRRAWGELSRDSLAGLATRVREKVDQVAPETRLCLCQSGASEREGNFTEAVTQAFAGKTRPVVRVYGAAYFSDDPLSIPIAIFNPLYQKQHLPPHFEIIHESDTFPHTRFFMSSSKLKSMLTAALAYGLDDSLLYVTQYLENPLEEDGYSRMFQKESGRFSALKAAVKNCHVDGCEILRKPGTPPNWIYITGRFGIPHTSAGGKVKLVSGDVIEQMSDEEIADLLKGSVFLDGLAAYHLSSRGYSKLIGAGVASKENSILPPFYEGIRDPEKYENINNRIMYNYDWAFAANAKDVSYLIKPLKGAEVITDFLDSNNVASSPAMTQFENELGGRVAIMAFNLSDSYVTTRSCSIYHYSKKELVKQTIEWLGKESLPVFVKHRPNIFCIFNRSKSNDYAIVVITSLATDSFETFSLDLAEEWINSRFELLTSKGEWRSTQVEKKNSTIEVKAVLSIMDPVILKISKRT